MSENLSTQSNPLNSFLEETDSGTDFNTLFTEPVEAEISQPPAQTYEEVVQKELNPPPVQGTVNAGTQSQFQPTVPQQTQQGQTQQVQIQAAVPAQKAPAQQNSGKQMSFDPFAEALQKAQAQSNQRVSASFAETNPIFSYGKASDEITDKEITFDKLREQYETDFPELNEKKKVSWSIVYGKVNKFISKPEADLVFDIKAEIEKSKQFLDGVKNAKKAEDKEPKCLVKPRVTAQSKGEARIPDYKGYSVSLEDAIQSDKQIIIMPSKDGRIFEMRKTPVGTFIAPADYLPEFPELESRFQMVSPKIPVHILLSIINFFKTLSDENELEALVHILYDTRRDKYTVRVPKQTITHTAVHADLEKDYPEHLTHVMDIHSHNTMPAKFSARDDQDEKATRLYAVIGRLDKLFPDITVRASCGGKFTPVKLADVFDGTKNGFQYPKVWDGQITLDKNLGCRQPFYLPEILKPLLLKGGDTDEIF